ncbi:MAG: hypothetical protein AAB869_03440 [Patescibacteria group bacterium]
MKRVRLVIIIALILLFLIGAWIWQTHSSKHKIYYVNTPSTLLARGQEVAKSAPKPGTPEWMNWYQRLSAEDRWAWATAMDENRTPPEPTKEQRDAVRIEDWKPQGAASLFPAKVLYNYRPLLRMDKSVSIRPLQVETIRAADGNMISTMWARRAKDSIVVDWANKSVVKGNVDNIKSVGGPSPEYIPPGMLMGEIGDRLLVKLSDSQHFKLPWDRDSVVYPLAMDEKSKYAFGAEKMNDDKNGKRGHISSIVVVDVREKKVAGIIPIPAVKTTLHCIFEPNDYLMVFDYDAQWIMLLDIKKSLVAEQKTSARDSERQ